MIPSILTLLTLALTDIEFECLQESMRKIPAVSYGYLDFV